MIENFYKNKEVEGEEYINLPSTCGNLSKGKDVCIRLEGGDSSQFCKSPRTLCNV